MTTASSPIEALQLLGRERTDIIFVKHSLCGENRSDIMRSVHALKREAPVVMMLPALEQDEVLQALGCGACDCAAMDPAALATYPVIAERALARHEGRAEHQERSRTILRSQMQWMSIIDAITDYIFVLNGDRILVKVNSSFAAAIGRHPRDIVGHRISDVFHPDIPDEPTLQAVIGDGVSRVYEMKLNEDIYQVSIFPLLEDDRQFTIHVMKNITEVRRLKDQLYHADKLASIGLLVSGVAHEINNPLTGTIAYSELLMMRATDESVKAELRKILDSAERCKKIIDNLLVFSRQRTPSKSLESINDIIDRAIDLRSYWLKKYHIQIQREFDPTSTVFVDTQQIQQVFMNLLLNAEQALVTAGQTNGAIRFITRFNKDARQIMIRVIDNGPGVPEKVALKIFDPFFTTKPVGIGTGLGLSIAHGIITEHGGTILYEPFETGGAAFTINLPIGTASLAGATGSGDGRQVR